MHRWTARAAGGMSHRLNPGFAMMRSRARKLGTATYDLRTERTTASLLGTTGWLTVKPVGRYDDVPVLARSTADRYAGVTGERSRCPPGWPGLRRPRLAPWPTR